MFNVYIGRKIVLRNNYPIYDETAVSHMCWKDIKQDGQCIEPELEAKWQAASTKSCSYVY